MPLSIPRDRIAQLLAGARSKRIAVIGDAMLDLYLRGEVERISPEAPVPVVRVLERRSALGGAANVVQNVRGLDAACEFVAAVGDDANGKMLRSKLAEIGVSSDSLVTIARPTTTKTRIVARGQQVVRVDEEDDDDLSRADAERLMKTADQAIDRSDALVLEDYNKGVLVPAVIERAIARARSRGIPVVVDPKFRNFFAYRGASIFKPNRRELASALGADVDLEHPDALPAALSRLGVEHLLLTLGDKGMALIRANGSVKRIPTVAREVYDVVGAGDTVTAYLSAVLAAGGNPDEAAVIANYAAGVEVGKSGAAIVRADEVLAAYDDFAAAQTGTSK
ncbi:MAG TPA: bifunctional ADP-heptose synthase [Gemmatimonadaceae bacterium]|jgi:D-beta-D-heptose 7-phosphate kinase/D-beta-D-heptose 1-phosphate adenosyltransferase